MADHKFSWKKIVHDFILITLGGAFMALSVNLFLEPHNIVPGGVTGLAMTINYLVSWLPIGMLVLAFNIPLFLMAFLKFGSKFLIGSLYGTFIYSVFIDVSAPFLPSLDIAPLLSSIFGGVLMGVGLGIIFLQGATTGGSDVAARLLKIPFPHFQMGQMMLLVDATIVLFAGLVQNSINSVFYATINIYVGAVVVDKILYGVNFARVAYIISDEYDKIADAIASELERGVTFLEGQGAYSKKEKKVLLCVIKRPQIAHLKGLVKEIDPDAFIILSEANEVLGEGFGVYDKNAM